MVDATRVAGRPTMLAEYVATDIESFQAMFDACELHGRYPEELDEIITEMAESATVRGGLSGWTIRDVTLQSGGGALVPPPV